MLRGIRETRNLHFAKVLFVLSPMDIGTTLEIYEHGAVIGAPEDGSGEKGDPGGLGREKDGSY